MSEASGTWTVARDDVARDDVARDDVAWQQVGNAIRQRRQAHELTLVELAARTDLSQPFLSQIENGRACPSMASLYRIAHALATTPQSLFGGPGPDVDVTSIIRRDEAAALPVGNTTVAVCRVLLPGDAPFHLVEFDGLPTEFFEPWEHDGFEAAYVVAGEIEIEIDGEITQLGPGDVVSYPARLPHRHRAVGTEPVRLLLIETKVERVEDRRPITHA